MAKAKINKDVIEDLVFGFTKSPVQILNAEYDPMHEMFTFEISGLDVPETDKEIRVVCSQISNRAGQKFITMEFEK